MGEHGQGGARDHLLRHRAQRVRRVLSVFHLPRGLTLHNWADTLESLPGVILVIQTDIIIMIDVFGTSIVLVGLNHGMKNRYYK